MANLNVYAGSTEEKQEINENLSNVAKSLGLDTYKGASASALIRWLGQQDRAELAEALRPLRQREFQAKAEAMGKQ